MTLLQTGSFHVVVKKLRSRLKTRRCYTMVSQSKEGEPPLTIRLSSPEADSSRDSAEAAD